MNVIGNFIHHIIKETLELPLSDDNYVKFGGSKNVLYNYVNPKNRKYKYLSVKTANVMRTVVLNSINGNQYKRNMLYTALEIYFSEVEIEYMKRFPDDEKAVISMAIVKFMNPKYAASFFKKNENFNDETFLMKERVVERKKYINTLCEIYSKVLYYFNHDKTVSMILSRKILETIYRIVILEEGYEAAFNSKSYVGSLKVIKDYNLVPPKIMNLISIIEISLISISDGKESSDFEVDDFVEQCVISINVIMKWFLKDYLHIDETLSDIEISTFENKKGKDNKMSDLKALNAYDIKERGWDLGDVLKDWIKVDYETIEDLTPEFVGTFNQWLPIINEHSETWSLLVNEKDKIVGYWHFLPLFDEEYNKALEGNLLDSEINVDMVPVLIPGTYNIYFVGICLSEKYRKTQGLRKLMDSLFNSFLYLAENDVFIDKICTLAYSDSGRVLSKSMDLKFYKEHPDHGQIYHGDIFDFLKHKFSDNYEKLVGLYSNRKPI